MKFSRPAVLLATVWMFGVCMLPAAPSEQEFQSPPPSAGIRCFWWWLNSNVTKEAITRDLEEMKAKGFSGALIFDADGSSQGGHERAPNGPAFVSPEWTGLLVHACQEAKRLDLELSLNIQSGWNLGGPQVTAEETTQGVVFSKTEITGPAKIDQPLPMPKSREFYRDISVLAIPLGPVGGAEPRLRPIEELKHKAAYHPLGMSAPDCRHLLESSAAEAGEFAVPAKDVLDLSRHMDAEGKLRWDAPPGRWAILRFGHTDTGSRVSTHSQGWGGRVVDIMSDKATRGYWQQNVVPLLDAVGPLAGSTLKYVHTDSWEGGGMNWTPGFEASFLKNRGYEMTPWLPVLAGYVVGNRDASTAFLADFRKTIGDLVADHYELLAKLAAERGMFTHPECSGPHASPLDGLKNYGRSELMLSEFWSPSPHRPLPVNRFFVKQASSAAHTYGKRLVGAEGFTTIGPQWNDTPWRDMKHSFDKEICAGMNILFVHTFTCAPKETGIPGQEYFAGTHFNPQITWWQESKAVIDYFRRCQVMTQQGQFIADVLYYYGDHIPNIAQRKDHDPARALPEFDYDVLSEELLIGDLRVKDGKLVLSSGMEYRVLVLPDHGVLSIGALRKVKQLVEAGATVIGPKPVKAVTLEDGIGEFHAIASQLWDAPATTSGELALKKYGKGQVISQDIGSRQVLLNMGVLPDVSIRHHGPASQIDWIHRRVGDADVYFIAEIDGKAQDLTASFRVENRIPEIWDPVDGSIREASTFTLAKGQTHVPLKLGPFDSRFVVFRKVAEQSRDKGPNHMSWSAVQNIGGPWSVNFDPAWGGPEQPVTFEELTSWKQHKIPGIRHYSGKATYRKTFTLAAVPSGKKLAIELGRVEDVGIARVKLNGQDLGVTWRPPFRVDVGQTLRAGENTIEITVVNSWRNRLTADKALPENQRLTRTNIRDCYARAPWVPLDAGLLGPVRLVSGEW